MDSTEVKQVACDIAHTEQQPIAAAQDGRPTMTTLIDSRSQPDCPAASTAADDPRSYYQSGGVTRFGQKFILAMPNSTVTGSELNIVLTNPGTADLTVTSIRTSTSVTDNYTSQPETPPKIKTSELRRERECVETLVLSAGAPFGVLVYGTRAQDGYMALPVEAWGQRHVVGTFCQGDGRMCEVVVIASRQNTKVNITFPVENLVFQSEDISPVPRTPIVYELGANQALVVQRPFELSGTLIKSDADVGVLAGAQWTLTKGPGAR
ncbi:hypothetical protein C0Q70_06213 [Pomacea canaliculata]|uniref:IgGFc-binding protein N-terminal domain-containing protein n=1 Tax=Pomacea canaliculata TaxID=400727 RepID=A0A2T7PNF1_POMCA|nr:hypothetical protein C0Q70_06213 [Pomacea canaliculata]